MGYYTQFETIRIEIIREVRPGKSAQALREKKYLELVSSVVKEDHVYWRVTL